MKTIFLFNKNNLKKAVSIIGLATGLGIGTMMYTGCQQPTEPTPTGIEQEITDNYTTTLGNGNYVMHNFMVTRGCSTLNESVNKNLTKAESYIKGLVKGFSENLKAKYDKIFLNS